jgi:hypothetical protein
VHIQALRRLQSDSPFHDLRHVGSSGSAGLSSRPLMPAWFCRCNIDSSIAACSFMRNIILPTLAHRIASGHLVTKLVALICWQAARALLLILSIAHSFGRSSPPSQTYWLLTKVTNSNAAGMGIAGGAGGHVSYEQDVAGLLPCHMSSRLLVDAGHAKLLPHNITDLA